MKKAKDTADMNRNKPKISLESMNVFNGSLKQGIKRIAFCTGNAVFTDEENIMVIACDRVVIGCFEVSGRRSDAADRAASYEWAFSNFVIFPKYRKEDVFKAVFPTLLKRYHGIIRWEDDAGELSPFCFTAGMLSSSDLPLRKKPTAMGRTEYRVLNRFSVTLEMDADTEPLNDALLSVEDAAELLGIGHSLMYKLINAGELAPEVGHKRMKIRSSALSEWVTHKLEEQSFAG